MDRDRLIAAKKRCKDAIDIGTKLVRDMVAETRVHAESQKRQDYHEIAMSCRRMAALCGQRAEAYRRFGEDAEAIHFFLKNGVEDVDEDR